MVDMMGSGSRRRAMVTERPSALLTDLYQLNMDQAYLEHGETATAVFEFFVRNLPARRGFLLAAGLEQTLDFLENLRFSASTISPAFDSPAMSTPCPKARCFSPTSRSCGLPRRCRKPSSPNRG
jgi:hypothetical protein